MKMCSRCQIEQTEDNFNWKYKERGIRQYHCKKCQSALTCKHYQKNKQPYKDRAKETNKARRNATFSFLIQYLELHPCVDCGETDPIVLQFDHVFGQKESSVSNLVNKGRVSALKQEIEKCEVRCANCHTRKTAQQFGWRKLLGG